MRICSQSLLRNDLGYSFNQCHATLFRKVENLRSHFDLSIAITITLRSLTTVETYVKPVHIYCNIHSGKIIAQFATIVQISHILPRIFRRRVSTQ